MKSLLLLTLLAMLAPLCSSQVPDTPLDGQCQLQGYDLRTLTSATYWSYSVNMSDPLEWVVPTGINDGDIARVDITMSLCKPLPNNECSVGSQTSVCQHITLTNNTIIDIELATFDKENKFEPLEEDTEGFSIQQESTIPASTRECQGKNFSTVITFKCSPFSKWTKTNVTNMVLNVGHFNCVYFLEVVYNGSCYISPTLSPGNCQLDGYDTETLAREPYWFATVPHTVCYNGTEDSTCHLIFSFCHVLPDENALFNLETCHSEEAAVCQIGLTSEGNKNLEYSMGKYKDITQFFENDDSVAGGFHTDVTDGSRPDNSSVCDHYLNTRIILVCNKSAHWPDNRNLSNLLRPTYDEQCQYTLVIEYSGACISVGPFEEPVSPVGWIFIGIFLVVAALYLVVGMAFQYFVKGARGADIIPNYTFWVAFGSLVTDGCKYTVDLVTCFKFRSGIQKSRPLGASGVKYDQI